MPSYAPPATQRLSASGKGQEPNAHRNKIKNTSLKPKHKSLQNRRPPQAQRNTKSQGARPTLINVGYRLITNRPNESCLRIQNTTRHPRKHDKPTLKLPPLAKLTMSELRMDWVSALSTINRTGFLQNLEILKRTLSA